MGNFTKIKHKSTARKKKSLAMLQLLKLIKEFNVTAHNQLSLNCLNSKNEAIKIRP